MTTPDRPSATGIRPYLIAAALVIPQVLLSLFAVPWVRLQGMRAAGCETRCDYALYDVANYGFWVILVLLLGITFAVLVVWLKKRRKSWPIVVLGGLALTGVATFIATQVVLSAFVA